MNRPIFVDDPEIEGATIGQMQRELEAESVKAGDIESDMSGDASLHFKVGRHRLARIGKMLVDGEMVMHASDRPVCLGHFAIAHWLLDQSLHHSVPPLLNATLSRISAVPAGGAASALLHEPREFSNTAGNFTRASSIWQIDARSCSARDMPVKASTDHPDNRNRRGTVMTGFKRILCPVDFSEFSRHALDEAIAMAHLYDGCVTALHVFPIAIPADPFGGLPEFQPFTLTDLHRAHILRQLSNFAVGEGAEQ